METWLIWKLTCGKIHVTDYANASRTMLFNIHTLDWDDEILEILNIPRCMLPKPVPNSGFYEYADPMHFGGEIKIAGSAGRPAGGPLRAGLFHAGGRQEHLRHRRLPADEHRRPAGAQPQRAGDHHRLGTGRQGDLRPGGVHLCGGGRIQWLRDELKILEEARDSEYMALKVPDTNGCYVVPAFTGLGAPHWDQYRPGRHRGTDPGLQQEPHHPRHAGQPVLPGQRCGSRPWRPTRAIRLAMLKVDGGASANNYLLQARRISAARRWNGPAVWNTTALGAAYLAGLAVGYWDSPAGVLQNRAVDRVFTPADQRGGPGPAHPGLEQGRALRL